MALTHLQDAYEISEPVAQDQYLTVRHAIRRVDRRVCLCHSLAYNKLLAPGEEPCFEDIDLWSRLSHPCLLMIHEIVHEKHQRQVHVIVDEPVGQCMRDIIALNIKNCTYVDEKMQWRVLSSLVDALAYLHSPIRTNTKVHLRMAHRYICPETIYVLESGVVQLSPPPLLHLLGIRQLSDVPMSARGYLAPEILMMKSYGDKVDMWGLGCTIFEYGSNKRFIVEAQPALMERRCEEISSTVAVFNLSPIMIKLLISLLQFSEDLRISSVDLRQHFRIKDTLQDPDALYYYGRNQDLHRGYAQESQLNTSTDGYASATLSTRSGKTDEYGECDSEYGGETVMQGTRGHNNSFIGRSTQIPTLETLSMRRRPPSLGNGSVFGKDSFLATQKEPATLSISVTPVKIAGHVGDHNTQYTREYMDDDIEENIERGDAFLQEPLEQKKQLEQSNYGIESDLAIMRYAPDIVDRLVIDFLNTKDTSNITIDDIINRVTRLVPGFFPMSDDLQTHKYTSSDLVELQVLKQMLEERLEPYKDQLLTSASVYRPASFTHGERFLPKLHRSNLSSVILNPESRVFRKEPLAADIGHRTQSMVDDTGTSTMLTNSVVHKTGTQPVSTKTFSMAARSNSNPRNRNVSVEEHNEFTTRQDANIEVEESGTLVLKVQPFVMLPNFSLPNLQDLDVTGLMRAAVANNMNTIRHLVADERELQCIDNAGRTALMYAAAMNSIDAVEMLMRFEAGFSSKEGLTALMFAANRGYNEIVKLLTNQEAQMQANNGMTALIIATSNYHLETAEILLDLEAGIQDASGKTALMYAARNGDEQLTMLLAPRESGIQSAAGETALMHALLKGHNHISRLLYFREVGRLSKERGTALMICAKTNNPEIAQKLIEKEGLLQNIYGMSALMYAAREGNIEIVAMLHKIEGGLKNNEGLTAMMLAAQKGHLDIVKRLIEKEVGIQDLGGYTALMHAVRMHRRDIIEYLSLFEAGFQRDSGETALTDAIHTNNIPVVKILAPLERTRLLRDGRSPGDVARSIGNEEISLIIGI